RAAWCHKLRSSRASSSPRARRSASTRSARLTDLHGHPPRHGLGGGSSTRFARLTDLHGHPPRHGLGGAPRLAPLVSPIFTGILLATGSEERLDSLRSSHRSSRASSSPRARRSASTRSARLTDFHTL